MINRILKFINKWKKSYLIYLISFIISCVVGIFAIKGDPTNFAPQNVGYLEIFLNNLNVGLLLLIGGIFTGGTLSLILIMVNGFIVGNVIHVAIAIGNIKSLFTGLLPHFFFEVFGLLSFAVLGSFTGYILIKLIINQVHQIEYRRLITDGLLMTFLLVGALIEDFVSFVYIQGGN